MCQTVQDRCICDDDDDVSEKTRLRPSVSDMIEAVVPGLLLTLMTDTVFSGLSFLHSIPQLRAVVGLVPCHGPKYERQLAVVREDSLLFLCWM